MFYPLGRIMSVKLIYIDQVNKNRRPSYMTEESTSGSSYHSQRWKSRKSLMVCKTLSFSDAQVSDP